MNGAASIKYIALSILFIIASINFTRTTLDIIKSSQRLDDLRSEVTGMEEEKAGLEESVAYKQSDAYVEEKARNDLNMAKIGEKLYVIIDKNAAKNEKSMGYTPDVLSVTDSADDKPQEESDENNLYLWYRLFF